jgi:hypothetical protein
MPDHKNIHKPEPTLTDVFALAFTIVGSGPDGRKSVCNIRFLPEVLGAYIVESSRAMAPGAPAARYDGAKLSPRLSPSA